MGNTTSLRQASLREANSALVLRSVCASPVAISRAGVASATGMTRATASRLTDELLHAGLVEELSAAPSGRGRPGTPLRPSSSVVAVGMQIDVSTIAVRVVDLAGNTVAEEVEHRDLEGAPTTLGLGRLRALTARVREALPSDSRITGARLALPGIVDGVRGCLLSAPNLGWQNLRIRSVAGLPVTIGNEADLAAVSVAEPVPGRPSELRDFLYLSGNVGVGGAVIIDGRARTGSRGWGGEVGHVTVDPSGSPCSCGSTGCLEQYAGSSAILRAAGLSNGHGVDDVFSLAAQGDARANEALTATTAALAVAVAGVINVLDVPTIVLGGHLSRFAGALSKPLAQRVLSSRWSPLCVLPSPSVVAPAATGAAIAELRRVLEDPWHLRKVAN